jgi:hypothetical protein
MLIWQILKTNIYKLTGLQRTREMDVNQKFIYKIYEEHLLLMPLDVRADNPKEYWAQGVNY